MLLPVTVSLINTATASFPFSLLPVFTNTYKHETVLKNKTKLLLIGTITKSAFRSRYPRQVPIMRNNWAFLTKVTTKIKLNMFILVPKLY